MKAIWSSHWKSSVQPRKQRKYRHNAPLHIRQKFLSANLSLELRTTYKRRSLQVRKGDEVEVKRGPLKGTRKAVERVDLRKTKVYLDGVRVKKVNGTEVLRPFQPSNLMIVKLHSDDKARLASLQQRKQPATPATK